MRVFIAVLVLIFSFQSFTKADDIRDFEIEGLSVGETILKFMDSSEIKGQVFAIFVMTIAAAESVIALAILLSIYRNKESIAMEEFNILKW